MYQTRRTQLVSFTKEYADDYKRWRNNDEIIQFEQSGDLYPLSDSEIMSFISYIEEAKESVSMIILDRESQKAIGFCALMKIDHKNQNLELAITIGEKEYWHQGYGKEVMTFMIDLSFRQFNIHKIYLRVMSGNARAIRLYESLHFQPEGRLKEFVFRNGQWQDMLYYSLFRNDYLLE